MVNEFTRYRLMRRLPVPIVMAVRGGAAAPFAITVPSTQMAGSRNRQATFGQVMARDHDAIADKSRNLLVHPQRIDQWRRGVASSSGDF